MTPNCCICGQFCPWTSDCSTPFGDATMTEPPDEEFYCDACAEQEEEAAVGRGWVPNDWRKSRWQTRAAERLGMIAVAPSKGAGWTVWKKEPSS